MTSKYKVREALPGDKDIVLDIHGDVYGGLDYLQDYYDYFQQSEHITPYVCEEHGEIVAYVASCHVDDGKSAVTRAGRVRPDKQGQHVYKRFKDEIENIHRTQGTILRHVLVKSEPPSASFLRSYKKLASRAIHMYDFDIKHLLPNIEKITGLSASGSLRVLDNIPERYFEADVSNVLFPEGVVILDWVPYSLLDSNRKLMKGKNTVFVSNISKSSGEALPVVVKIKQNSVSNGALLMEPKNTLDKQSINSTCNTWTHVDQSMITISGLMSASTIFRAHHDADISCNLDIFGDDLDSLLIHLAYHTQRIMTKERVNAINLRIYTNLKIGKEEVDRALDFIGIPPLASDIRKKMYIQQDVYEKPI